MTFFKLLWGFDAVVAIIVLYFFIVGLADGTVSSFNITIWLLLLAALMVIMLGSVWLRSHNHPSLAIGLLLILGLPAFLYLLMILVMLIGKPDFR